VKLMLDRATELKVAGTRPSGFIDVTIGADETGKIIAWDSHHWGSGGIAGGAIPVGGVPYVFDFENRNRSATQVNCNVGPTRAWRAPPHPQLCILTHCAIDDLAWKMGKDSYDVFLANLDQSAGTRPITSRDLQGRDGNRSQVDRLEGQVASAWQGDGQGTD
jgi:xanthine dehydrogenase YagR molybdenum-binding subunit